MERYVLVGNPVVSLDNMSVFAHRARREQIAKKKVCHLCFFAVMGFLWDTNHEFNKPQ